MFIRQFTQSFGEAVKIKTQSMALCCLKHIRLMAVSYHYGFVVMFMVDCLHRAFGKMAKSKQKALVGALKF